MSPSVAKGVPNPRDEGAGCGPQLWPEARVLKLELSLMLGSDFSLLRSFRVLAAAHVDTCLGRPLAEIADSFELGEGGQQALRPLCAFWTDFEVGLLAGAMVGGESGEAAQLIAKMDIKSKGNFTFSASPEVGEFLGRLGAAQDVGIPIADGLKLASTGLSSRMIAASEAIASQVQKGSSLASAMKELGELFKSDVVRLVDIGEETGKLSRVLLVIGGLKSGVE